MVVGDVVGEGTKMGLGGRGWRLIEEVGETARQRYAEPADGWQSGECGLNGAVAEAARRRARQRRRDRADEMSGSRPRATGASSQRRIQPVRAIVTASDCGEPQDRRPAIAGRSHLTWLPRCEDNLRVYGTARTSAPRADHQHPSASLTSDLPLRGFEVVLVRHGARAGRRRGL